MLDTPAAPLTEKANGLLSKLDADLARQLEEKLEQSVPCSSLDCPNPAWWLGTLQCPCPFTAAKCVPCRLSLDFFLALDPLHAAECDKGHRSRRITWRIL
jgi:hypothetical protein